MKTFIVELAGEAILAFRANDLEEADGLVNGSESEEGGIKSELLCFDRPDGRTLWDAKTPLIARLATPAEHAVWKRRREGEIGCAADGAQIDPSMGDDPDDFNVFLVPIVDPLADDDDDGDGGDEPAVEQGARTRWQVHFCCTYRTTEETERLAMGWAWAEAASAQEAEEKVSEALSRQDHDTIAIEESSMSGHYFPDESDGSVLLDVAVGMIDTVSEDDVFADQEERFNRRRADAEEAVEASEKHVQDRLANSSDDDLVRVRRQWNDARRTALVHIDDLSGLHFSNVSGGVNATAPRDYLHGYMLCTHILRGDLAHSCKHGPAPHDIKVCIVKKDNCKEVYAELLRRKTVIGKLEKCPWMVDLGVFHDKAKVEQLLRDHSQDQWTSVPHGWWRDGLGKRSRPSGDQVWFASGETAQAFAAKAGARFMGHMGSEKQAAAAKFMLAGPLPTLSPRAP